MPWLARPNARFAFAVTLIALAAMAVRVACADHSLWFDELASLYFSGQPVSKLWSGWIVRETNPPLYYSLLRGWIAAFGDSDVSVRLPSIAASGVAIALAARLAARIYGVHAGIIVALLAAVSAHHLFYSLQARSYIFAFCVTTIGIAALLTIAQRLGERPLPYAALAGYVLSASIAVYLHTTMLLFPVIGLVSVTIARFDRVRADPLCLMPLVIANLAVLAVAGWWIWITLLQVRGGGDNIAATGTLNIPFLFQRTSVLFLARGNGGVNLALLLVCAITAGFIWLDRRRFETRFFAVLLLLTVALFGAIGYKIPVYVARTLFWVSLVPLLFTGAALARIKPLALMLGTTAVMLTVLALNTATTIARIETEDWNSAIRAAAIPGGILLVASESMAIDAEIACGRIAPRCPITIVAVTDPADTADSWARGLYRGPKLPIEAVGRLPDKRPIFLFRKEAFHNLLNQLHQHGMARSITDTSPLVGPYPVAALR